MIADLPESLRKSGAIEVLAKLGTIAGGDILDVGTQKGDFINVLMKVLKGYNTFTGIDISEEDLEEARERFKDKPASFLLMNAESMIFQDNQFDTVCISYSLHHLENINKVLDEMYRVLKPKGHFIIQEMYSDGEQSAAQQLDTLVHHLNAKVDSLLGIPHFETLTRQRMRDYVCRIGLRDIEVFDSTWSVKCLFCDDVHDCLNPTRTSHIDSVIRQIDSILSKVREHPSYAELKEEAELLKEQAKTDGAAEASLMYFFGIK